MTTLRMPERTGWRDEKISMRHRLYGSFATMTDIDFPVIEYTWNAIPKAIIEYKHYYARPANWGQINALRNLSNLAGLPFFLANYCNEEWWYRVHPQNDEARKWFMSEQDMTEHQYVTLLRDLREVDDPIPEGLNHIAPPRRKAEKAS